MNNENKDTTETTNTENTSQDNPLKGSMDTDENIKSSLKDQNRNSGAESEWAFVGGIGVVLLINISIFFAGLIPMIYMLAGGSTHYNYIIKFFVELILSLPTVLIGIGQLLYVIPWVIQLKRSGEPMMANGIIAGAVITALLNGGCYLMMQ